MKNTIEKTYLSPEDYDKFFEALNAPAKEIPALTEAMRRYKGRVISR